MRRRYKWEIRNGWRANPFSGTRVALLKAVPIDGGTTGTSDSIPLEVARRRGIPILTRPYRVSYNMKDLCDAQTAMFLCGVRSLKRRAWRVAKRAEVA